MREPLYFIFTIDTEISMGGAARDPALRPVGARRRIWGELDDGRQFGIKRFIEIFDRHKQRAVFFFEPYAKSVVPEEELAEAARFIVNRGHELELHIHHEFEMDLPRVQRGEAPHQPRDTLVLVEARHDHGHRRRQLPEPLLFHGDLRSFFVRFERAPGRRSLSKHPCR